MTPRNYTIGIDVGLKSVGFAAVEIDVDGMPVRILKAMSAIHDGGVDPNSKKTGESRRLQAGIARRTRRMRRRRRARLERLDAKLRHLGYPIVDERTLQGFGMWHIRAHAATEFISNDEERACAVSIACRTIARHRGWRNPYHCDESLLGVQEPRSEQYQQLREKAMEWIGGEYIPENATPAQIVDAVLSSSQGPAVRIRTSESKKHGHREGLITTRLMQEDNAYELERILRVQQVPDDVARSLVLEVFRQKSPRGSAEKRVGKDPLAPNEPRALKASLAFQRYRIANMITNLRIQDGSELRRLTVDEKQMVYNRLASQKIEKNLVWVDVCKDLGISRRALKGVGALTSDGEERIASRPPQLTSLQRIAELKDTQLRKALLAWWENHEDAQEAMITLLSNTVDIDAKREEPEYAEAVEFIESLDDAQLTKLDAIDLPVGRAAYSVPTLTVLTERMLKTDDDLHEARKVVFGVDDNWRPPQAAIGAPLGNTAVDRVLKLVSRFLVDAQKRWGKPAAVNIEHVRDGFSSEPAARRAQKEYERYIDKRTQMNQELESELRNHFGLEKVRPYDLRRLQAIQRQNGVCLYCGCDITFTTCEMDHIVPRKGAGSTNTRNNFAAVCEICNRMKSNTPFAVWAQTESAQKHGVSLTEAIERVKMFNAEGGTKADRIFRTEVITRLKQTESDDPIDNRSIESVAWMADELHRRIDWYFNSDGYAGNLNDDNSGVTKVCVYAGSLTAEGRRASGIEGDIHFAAASYKTRLDRRHHAVDAAVIAMMTPAAALSLKTRSNMRRSWLETGDESLRTAWKNYPAEQDPGYASYQQWLDAMRSMLVLLNDALDNDRIPVIHAQRYAFGNSNAHDATVKPLLKIPLRSAMDADLIRRASTPALYCALTRLPDYSSKTGLPEDSAREIMVNGGHYTAADTVPFFEGGSAQIQVQGGSADIGNAIHHARIYKCYKETKKGRVYFYGMIRVFQTDLLRARHEDLFAYPLSPQTVSMRYADPKVAEAVQNGHAEYKGYLVVGDEIEVKFGEAMSDKIGAFVDFFSEQMGVQDEIVQRWVVSGFESSRLMKLRPAMLAEEGLDRIFGICDVSKSMEDDVRNVFARSWRLSVSQISQLALRVIRRNSLGEKRFVSKNQMPTCWSCD